MKKEDLLELGLNETQAEAVFKMRGKGIEATKLEISGLKETQSTLEQARDDALSQLQAIKDSAVDIDDYNKLKDASEKFEDKIKELGVNHSKEIEAIKFDHILDDKIKEAGAFKGSSKFVKSALNKEALKFEDGKVIGLDEEIERVKSEHVNLFDSEGVDFSYTTRHSGGGRKNNNPFKAKLEKYK